VDNITHSLTGILLARAGLDRFTPHAAWILFLAANAPDADVVSAFGGSLNYLHYHRHLTHSLVALPLLPLVCVLAVRLVSRQPVNWAGAYMIALIGVASHLVLDLTNVYGVRLLLPFSERALFNGAPDANRTRRFDAIAINIPLDAGLFEPTPVTVK